MSELKGLRKKLTGSGFDPAPIDEELELLRGTKERKGLYWALDVEETPQKPKEDPDPAQRQRDLEDEKDCRTWELNTDGVRGLVADVISSNPPAAAIRILNALEDGENDKEPYPRKSVLDVIRDARKPLVAKVEKAEPAVAAGPALA